MRVIGAGVGRTGTLSLKMALQRLLGGRCYHMFELSDHPEHVETWHGAVKGRMPDWRDFLAPFTATVDWPAAAFWRELHEAFPDALVLLSTREPGDWWASVNRGIAPALRMAPSAQHAMLTDLLRARFTVSLHDRPKAMAAFEAHDALVRSTVRKEKLVVWRPGDGWAPLCSALQLPLPAEPFPHRNAWVVEHTHALRVATAE